ncbi:MAG: protein kinase [Candidatus Solibacter sp.]
MSEEVIFGGAPRPEEGHAPPLSGMTTERWLAIKEVFETALEIHPGQRAAYLAARCAGDPDLRAEVERLLEDDAEAGEFLATAIVHPERLLHAADLSAYPAGARIAGRFEVVRFLGRGGMGEVYEAVDRAIGDVAIALKTIRPEYAGDSRFLDQFRSEVQLARQVTHPNVCRIHDLYVEGEATSATGPGTAFLTMEFVGGETLAERLRGQGPFAPATALPLIRQVAEGLHAVHAAGIVHRDLKSANIMLTEDRTGQARAVVMDFGIASQAGNAAEVGLRGGTPGYLAPELLHGEAATVLSDVYALAVIAHEVFTGMRPVAAPPNSQHGQAHDPLSLLPDHQWRAIARGLDAQPLRRHPGAREFADALEGRAQKTRRRILMAVAGVAALGGAAAVAGNRFGHGSASLPQLVVMPFLPEGPSEDLAALGGSLASEVIRALASSPGFFAIGEESTRALTASLAAGLSAPEAGAVDDAAARSRAVYTGKRLSVPYVLTGTVGQSGANLVIRANLRAARDGALLWAQVFVEPNDRLPRLRAGIVQGVASAVNATLGTWARTALARPLTPNGEAYRKYLLAWNLAGRRSVPDLEASVNLLQEAIGKDPGFAQAWAALAASRNILAGNPRHPLRETFEEARTAAARAVALEPGNAQAHVVLASVSQRYDWNWLASDADYRSALASSPGMAVAHQWYSGLLSIRRLPDDAILESSRARELEPLSQPANTAYGSMLYRARRYPDAANQLEFTVQLSADYQPALMALGIVYRVMGRYPEAIARHERCVALSGRNPLALSWLGFSLGAAGMRERAIEIRNQLELRWPAEQFSPSALAQVCQGLGDLDGAFRWLELAVERRDPALTILRADPGNDLLRADARYERIVRVLNL